MQYEEAKCISRIIMTAKFTAELGNLHFSITNKCYLTACILQSRWESQLPVVILWMEVAEWEVCSTSGLSFDER